MYENNAHGDTMGLVNTSGNITRTYNNDAFGNSLLNSGSGAVTPFRYNGQYTDSETGLIYLRNRYYDPSIGRFTQEDPAKDGLNWYVYCANDPVNMVDPLGLFDYDTVLSYNPNQRNNDVLALQSELAYRGYLSANDVDGYFGQKTLDAVNAYKYDNGLWNDGEYYGKVGLTTWQSLGLIYRTQGDIDRGITIFTEAGGRQLFDVTKPINDATWDCGSEAARHKWDFLWFKSKVDHKMDWDIKRSDTDAWSKTVKTTYPGNYNTQVIFKGEYSTPEELGNILYGYAGSAAGFYEWILLAGGDYAAGGVGGILRRVDPLEDKAAIIKGIRWYYEEA